METFLKIVGWFVPALVSFALGYLLDKYRKVKSRAEQQEQVASQERVYILEAIKHFLRRELEDAYKYYNDKGYCSALEKSEINEIYNIYKSLGGNGRGKAIFDSINNLQERREKSGDNQ